MKKLIALGALLGIALISTAQAAQVDEDTYWKMGTPYGNSYNWYLDASTYDFHMIVNGSSVFEIDADGETIRLANDITLIDDTASEFKIADTTTSEDLTFTFSANTCTIGSDTAVADIGFGAMGLTTTGALAAGDTSLGGGAGALNFTAASSSVLTTDNAALGLVIGSAGHTNLLTLNTANDTESLIITGETAVEALKVDVGTVTFDETLTVTGATTLTGAATITDLDTAVVVQGDAPASCTVGQWFWDTAGTIELCYCDTTNDLLCIDVTTNATDPKD